MKKAIPYFILLFVAITPMRSNAQWGTSPFSFTFDSGDTLWPHYIFIDTIHFRHNIWQVGRPQKTVFDSAYSFPNVLITDTLNPYPPNDTSAFILTFPSALLSHYIYSVNFYYWVNMDSSANDLVEISNDSGRTWNPEIYGTAGAVGLAGMVQGCSAIPSWCTWSIYFDTAYYHTYPNDSLKLRFTFISGNDTSGKDGWMIDNVGATYQDLSVTSLQNNTFITIFPNPATTSLTITSPQNIIHITITNLIGQTVYTHEYNTPNVQLYVADLPPGIYFVKVNNTEVRKFVKE